VFDYQGKWKQVILLAANNRRLFTTGDEKNDKVDVMDRATVKKISSNVFNMHHGKKL